MNLLKAPKQGTMYAIYIGKVVYEPYTREQLLEKENLEVNLLELHLFDKEKEYRYIKKRKGYIETEISDETVELDDKDDKYEETIFTLKKNQEKPDENHGEVRVINYIKYDENDLLTIQDYRLAEV